METNITNEMIKEHLLSLTLSGDFQDKFDRIEAKAKSAFTRAYNKTAKDVIKVGKGKAPTAKEMKEAD